MVVPKFKVAREVERSEAGVGPNGFAKIKVCSDSGQILTRTLRNPSNGLAKRTYDD